MNKQFTAIAAIDANRALGYKNELFDKGDGRKEDFDFFKKITMDKTIIMGRKTYESIGKPLPKRKNIVISKSAAFSGSTAIPTSQIINDPCKYDWHQEEGELIILGGAEIYKLFMPFIQTFYITQFNHAAPNADAFLPELSNFVLSEIILDRPNFQIQKFQKLEFSSLASI
jgi:dihydrofolate reductase